MYGALSFYFECPNGWDLGLAEKKLAGKNEGERRRDVKRPKKKIKHSTLTQQLLVEHSKSPNRLERPRGLLSAPAQSCRLSVSLVVLSLLALSLWSVYGEEIVAKELRIIVGMYGATPTNLDDERPTREAIWEARGNVRNRQLNSIRERKQRTRRNSTLERGKNLLIVMFRVFVLILLELFVSEKSQSHSHCGLSSLGREIIIFK